MKSSEKLTDSLNKIYAYVPVFAKLFSLMAQDNVLVNLLSRQKSHKLVDKCNELPLGIIESDCQRKRIILKIEQKLAALRNGYRNDVIVISNQPVFVCTLFVF